MIMSSYFNVFAPKNDKDYADIVQNHTLPGVFPNFGGQCIVGCKYCVECNL